MKNILLFDLDGTLFNSKEGITKSVRYALKSYGIEVDDLDTLEKFIGPPLHKSFEVFYGFSEQKSIEAAAKYRERYKEKGWYECCPYEGVEEMLEKLKDSGKRMGIATSKPEVFAIQIMEKFGYDKYFESITGSLLDNTRTNKTDVIIEALKRFEISDNIEDVVMIGDREHDIIGAKENGLMSIGVEYGFANENELKNAGADYIVDNTKELTEILLKI